MTVMMTWFEMIGAMPSAWTVAVLGSASEQLLNGPSTKSESVAVGLWEERVSARKLEKQPPRPRPLRLMPSSRNSPWAGCVSLLLFLNDHEVLIADPFTIAYVVPGTVPS